LLTDLLTKPEPPDAATLIALGFARNLTLDYYL
jgi:hypothetical protein